MIFILFAVLMILLTFYFLGRRSIFGVSFINGNYSGLYLIKEIFVFIVPGVLLVNIFPLTDFYVFNVLDSTKIFNISLVILYSVFVFLAVVFLGSRYGWLSTSQISFSYSDKEKREITYFTLFLLILSLACGSIIYLSGGKHAFVSAVLNDVSLKEIRMHNKYHLSIPGAFKLFHEYLLVMITILIASPIFARKKVFVFCMFTWVLFSFSYSGAKAPIINIIVVYVISYLSLKGDRIKKRKLFLYVFVLSLIVLPIIVYLVSIQYPGYSTADYISYFINRIGVGQIGGAYEQLSIELRSSDYFYHAVPFGSFVFDYVPFQRELMVVTEGMKDINSTGTKNSLFISEALAIGGWFMVAVSPFIVACAYLIEVFVTSKLFSKFLSMKREFSITFSTILFFNFGSITGGFSEWLLLKLFILHLIFIFAAILPYKVFRLILRKGNEC